MFLLPPHFQISDTFVRLAVDDHANYEIVICPKCFVTHRGILQYKCFRDVLYVLKRDVSGWESHIPQRLWGRPQGVCPVHGPPCDVQVRPPRCGWHQNVPMKRARARNCVRFNLHPVRCFWRADSDTCMLRLWERAADCRGSVCCRTWLQSFTVRHYVGTQEDGQDRAGQHSAQHCWLTGCMIAVPCQILCESWPYERAGDINIVLLDPHYPIQQVILTSCC